MKRIILGVFSILLLFFAAKVSAQVPTFYSYQYVITQFDSEISIEKDTSLLVKETMSVNFPDERHGIFRVIPIVYSAKGKTMRAGFKVLSITDEFGDLYKYEQSRQGQSVRLKIGDSDKTVTGVNTYVITYQISKVIQRFEDHDEVYWNVTGSEWDTDILTSSATVASRYAEIKKVDCFAGTFASTEKFCTSTFNKENAEFSSTDRLGSGRDFTVVVALDKNNQLVFPGRLRSLISSIFDNWGYLVSVLPFASIFYFWLKRGRDLRFIGENVYYDEGKGQMTKPLFVREHLPTVYYPIQELTPSEVGTIVDEKVDIDDVVSEIVELARLGYLKIEKISKKKLIFDRTDYKFIKLKKDETRLVEYQVYLLEKLFNEGDEVMLSKLKNKFYVHLDEFKKKLYTSLTVEGVFDGAPDKVRIKWIAIFIVIEGVTLFLMFSFFNATGNFFPFIVLAILSIPGFFIATSMPRRTARGYSFYRQIKGLDFYLEKGKWREEIAEKHLFFGEMLPLAIALGIVGKLANDMQDLGVKPPDYFTGVTTSTLGTDIGAFSSSASSNLMSAPGGKGSSWSGGSGFSGGSSGGGFGGGGGGSW